MAAFFALGAQKQTSAAPGLALDLRAPSSSSTLDTRTTQPTSTKRMPAAEPAGPGRAKAAAVERLGDESPTRTNPTKSLDDTQPVRAHKGCHQAEQGAMSFRLHQLAFISVAAVCALSASGEQVPTLPLHPAHSPSPHSPLHTHSVCLRPPRSSVQPRCVSLALDLTPL